MLRRIAAVAVFAAALAPVSPAQAGWVEPFDAATPINTAGRNGGVFSLADVGGRPTIAWSEDATAPGAGNASVIHVAALGASGWDRLDELGEHAISRLATANSDNPDLADGGGQPWVVWAENLNGPDDKQIRVARPTGVGNQWTRVGDGDRPINHERLGPSTADNPAIAANGTDVYVAFDESDPGGSPLSAWVMHLDGDRWETAGGGSPAGSASLSGRPDLALVGGVPWVTYFQVDGAALQIRVSRLDGARWTQVGGVLASSDLSNPDLSLPKLAVVGGRPVVSFTVGSAISVYGLDAAGAGWQALGGPLSGADPSVADIGGALWVAWRGQNEGRAARLVDGAWVASGGPIIAAHGSPFDQGPRLAGVGGLPWVAFSSDDRTVPAPPGGRGCCEQGRVARLTPDWSGAGTAYPAATAAALLLSVNTFGLRYELGVRTTPLGGSPVSTPFTPANPLLAVFELHGLTPATIYDYVPFAIAGTREPVFGVGGRFVTPPADPMPQAVTPVSPAAAAPPKLVLAVLSHPATVPRGHAVRLVMLSTDAGTAELSVARKGKVVKRVTRSVGTGRWRISWSTGNAARGRYRLSIRLRTADGRVSNDMTTVRVT